ncbi:MAG: TonB-dependent receptor [Thiobacillus sp.]|nr:TonB-dependent receptor [Thiobacillus sp.]
MHNARRQAENSTPLFLLGGLGWVFSLLGVVAGTGQALAAVTESDFLEVLPIVLSASRLSQPVNEAPAAVTVIDQDMIRASGFRDIPDLFRLVPGFTVAYTRDNTWGVGYHGLGDAFSRRMQVLIDGRSVYTPGFGEVPWASLPLSIEDIERIEVVRGPNSAVYGSNAFLGIINIITKDPAQVSGGHLSVQAGERGMGGAQFRYGNTRDDLRYRLSVSDQRRDRFATQSEQTTTRHLDFRADYRLSATDEITTTFALSGGDWRHGRTQDIGDSIRRSDVGSEHFQTRFRRVMDAENEWSLQFYHTRLRNNDSFVAPLPSPPFPAASGVPVDLDYTQWRDNIEFQMITRPTETMRLVWGAEVRREGIKAPGFFYNQDARTGMLYRGFGNVEWRPSSRWIWHAGAMAEQHYLSGFDLSPRLAVNYLPSNDHAFRASVSRASRSPTFFEEQGDQRFFDTNGLPLDRVFAPTSGLHPEQIYSRELGYVGQIRPLKLQVDFRLFNDRITRLIGTSDIGDDPGSLNPKLFQAANQNSADIRGVEVQFRWKPQDGFDLVATYSRVNIRSDEVDIAESAPRNNFSALGMLKLAGGWGASVGVYRQDAMVWLGDGDVTLAFTRVDARLVKRWKWQGNPVELALVGQNLSSRPYQEFRNDNLFDRRAYLSLMFDW